MNLIVFFEPSTSVSTWRSAWPAAELARRGWDAFASAPDADMNKDVPPGVADVILHVSANTMATDGRQVVGPAWIAERIKHGARRLFVSFDDDWTANQDIQGSDYNETARRLKSEIPDLCRMAYRVIVSTPPLAEVYGRWANDVAVAENYLPRWVFDLPRKRRIDRLGYFGPFYKARGHDLELLRPFAADLPPMYLIGPGRAGYDLLMSWGVRDVLSVPARDDQRWLYGEIGRCRAGVVPLRDTRFNRGKSWTKPMEFMARGVPVVTSRHHEYERLPGCSIVPDAMLVGTALALWEGKVSLPSLPHSFRMEERGGDAWEKALM